MVPVCRQSRGIMTIQFVHSSVHFSYCGKRPGRQGGEAGIPFPLWSPLAGVFVMPRTAKKSTADTGHIAGDNGASRERLLQLAQPSRVLTRNEGREVDALCEAGKAHLQRAARNLVAGAGGRPVLVSYSGDGTPILCKKRWSARVAERVYRRSGGHADEYYVEKLFVSVGNPSGGFDTALVFAIPSGLRTAKGRGRSIVVPRSCFLCLASKDISGSASIIVVSIVRATRPWHGVWKRSSPCSTKTAQLPPRSSRAWPHLKIQSFFFVPVDVPAMTRTTHSAGPWQFCCWTKLPSRISSLWWLR